MKRLIKKPLLTALTLIFVVSAIVYIESKKPNLGNQDTNDAIAINKEKGSKYPLAPDFAGIERWINSEPLKIEQLKGKVVLADFWTYTCINCIRTLPYLKEWDKKYRNAGLVIVGIHTPEFEFEKKYENVLNAVNDYQLKYPVAQDNNYVTWSLYQNRYWPHKYLIDVDGYIRYEHIGEGGYEDTEKMIQSLLKERMERIGKQNDSSLALLSKLNYSAGFEPSGVRTPEIYFGYQFSRGNFGNKEGIKPDQDVDYKIPSSISLNNAYFGGKWKNNADNIELMEDEGEILLIFNAKSVNMVAGSDYGSKALSFIDNNQEPNTASNISEFKLYNLGFADDYSKHSIDVKITGKGFKIYTFTFG